MQSAIPLSTRAVSARGVSASQAGTHARTQPRPRLLDVWHETTEAIGAHAAPLLMLGVIGFAAATMIGPVLAAIAMPLTRMAIMQIVVRGKLDATGLRQLPVLLIIAWVYAVAITVGQVGVGVPLRAWGIDLNLAEQKSTTWEAAKQAVLLRSMDALLLTPDSPFKRWLPGWRNWVFDAWVRKPNDAYEQQLMADYWRNGVDILAAGTSGIEAQAKAHRENRSDLLLMFGGGILMLLVAETLFAFRSLVGAKPMRLVWLSLRHFGMVAVHLWLLRLIVVGLKALFVFAPIVVVDRYSYLAHDWGWFGSPVQIGSLSVCLALINAVCMMFEAAYVTRLFVTLHSIFSKKWGNTEREKQP